MAAVTGAIVAVGGLALSASQYVKSNKEKKDTRERIDSFQQQDLVNPFENLSISTLAADQQTDANLSRNASSVEALRRGGQRAILSGIPRLNESNVLLQNLISKDIERQEQERERLIAQGESNIQNIRENRELGALQGYGQQLQAARQDQATALGNFASSALALGSSIDNSDIFKGNGGGQGTGGNQIVQNQTNGANPLFYDSTLSKVFSTNKSSPIFETPNIAFSDFNFTQNS